MRHCTLRKTNLAQLLRGRTEGNFVAAFEQGEIGPDLFRHACRMGLDFRSTARAPTVAAGSGIGSKSRIGNFPLYSRLEEQFSRNDRERSA
jgi:bifunctional non-homologous end joining protein LigD